MRVCQRTSKFLIFLSLLCGTLALSAFADEGPLDAAKPTGVTPEEIIQRFAAKEKEFREARDQYTFRQSVTVQTIDGDTVTGEYREVFDVQFDDRGKHLENVVFAPQSSLENGGISMSPEDVDDIRHKLPFVLTSEDVGEYDVLYVGQQQEDELHCYVFDIAPKQIVGKKRYFQGRIWVDDHDFQIVKTFGKTVPETRVKKNGKGNENLFPKFTTWREQIDGKYWFPTYTKADDILHFHTGDIHIREIVKYTEYRRFGSNVKITYEGKDVQKGQDVERPGDAKPGDAKPGDAKPGDAKPGDRKAGDKPQP
jgi:outer membrane lipoprotein-sorting protein